MLLLKVSTESFHIHFTGPIQNKSIIAFDIMKFDNFIVFVEGHYYNSIPSLLNEMQFTLLRIHSSM